MMHISTRRGRVACDESWLGGHQDELAEALFHRGGVRLRPRLTIKGGDRCLPAADA